MQEHRIFIGLGTSVRLHKHHHARSSNNTSQQQTLIRNAVNKLDSSIYALHQNHAGHILGCSGYYLSHAWGQVRAGSYVNAVICISSHQTPRLFLRQLLQLEYQLGRRRSRKRWGPRYIDMDILLFGSKTIHQPELNIPHPWMWEREFVLWPLSELEDLLTDLQRQQLKKALVCQSTYPLTRPQRL